MYVDGFRESGQAVIVKKRFERDITLGNIWKGTVLEGNFWIFMITGLYVQGAAEERYDIIR